MSIIKILLSLFLKMMIVRRITFLSKALHDTGSISSVHDVIEIVSRHVFIKIVILVPIIHLRIDLLTLFTAHAIFITISQVL